MASTLLTSFPSLFPPSVSMLPILFTRRTLTIQVDDLYSPSLDPSPPLPEDSRHTSHAHGHAHQHQHPFHTATAPPGISLGAFNHSALRADENAIATRKANIRRFGAGWLRPPGIGKTLQGMEDERIEREEQEAAAMRYVGFLGGGNLC